jgi:hypothetical protein
MKAGFRAAVSAVNASLQLPGTSAQSIFSNVTRWNKGGGTLSK